MMQQHFIFILLVILFLGARPTFAQNIQTAKDSLLFIECAKFDRAYQHFDQSSNVNLLYRSSACTKAAIHIKHGEFHKASDLINAYPNYLKDDINAFQLNYFTALVTLARGNKNDAFKRLKAIHAQSVYKEDAEKLLAHFFKAAEEE